MEELTFEQKKKYILDFIKKQGMGIISTVRTNGLPDTAASYFFFNEDGTVALLSGNEAQKVTNIASNPNVLLTVTHLEEKTVAHLRGLAHIEKTTSTEIIHKFEELTKRKNENDSFDNILPILKYNKGPIVLIVIKPTELTWEKFNETGMEKECIDVTKE